MGLFKKATKQAAKLRLAIIGPSGSGKTYTALSVATALAPGKVAVIDTESGSASKYATDFDFDVAEMHAPFHPSKYISAIKEAAAAGYEVVVLDSVTHAWAGAGGVLEIVDEAAKRMKSGNSYVAWKEGTKVQNELTEAIVSAPIHVIATMRSKQEYVQEKDNNGRTVIRKVGMAPVQREGAEYEYDVLLEMNMDNEAIVSKSRCSELSGRVIAKPGAQVAKILADWLGGAPAPEPKKVERKSEPQPEQDFGMGQKQENPFEDAPVDATPYYTHAYNQLTDKAYDLVKWLSALHRESDGPCTTAQYQYLTGIVDKLTGEQHNYTLSVLCQSEISSDNAPGKKAASALLKIITETKKDDNDKKIPNPDYRADIAELITGIAQAAQPEAA